MKISLIGLPGSGKTTVGRQLSRKLGIDFFDSDHEIEKSIGCSIKEFFQRHGESEFRDAEQKEIDRLTALSGSFVVSTGGGAVLREFNRCNLHDRTNVIYLSSRPEELFKRLRHDKNRPLLQVSDPLAKLKVLFTERDPLCRGTAHFVLETGRPSVATLVNTIVMQLDLAQSQP